MSGCGCLLVWVGIAVCLFGLAFLGEGKFMLGISLILCFFIILWLADRSDSESND